MAAALLRHKLATDGKADPYEVTSAGTWVSPGQPASHDARKVMADQGIDLGDHRSREVDAEMVRQADLVLVMTQSHREALIAEFPTARGKTYLLSEMVGQCYDIADPYGDWPAVESCATELANLIERGYTRILELAGQDDTVTR
jgi:protein-tyrosine-phosphatase